MTTEEKKRKKTSAAKHLETSDVERGDFVQPTFIPPFSVCRWLAIPCLIFVDVVVDNAITL